MTTLKEPQAAHAEHAFSPTTTAPTANWRNVFIGGEGLRAGWRLLIYSCLTVTLLTGFVLIKSGDLRGFREQQRHPQVTITPALMGGTEAVAFAILCAAAGVMAKIEHKNFGDYGLPPRLALQKDFFKGALSGFLAISGTLGIIFLAHGFHIVGWALHGTAIVGACVGWGLAFLMAALFEEFLCRGYLLITLASGIGFWPAALATSFLFGFTHIFNHGETFGGAVSAGLFGGLFCLFLWRRGNLWMAVGFHMAWDWGQTFFGVPDSGILPYHNVFASAFHGPQWLTGGTVGPEASIITPIALAIVALFFVAFGGRTSRASLDGAEGRLRHNNLPAAER